jgi:PAS domain S-box-containing protein
MSTTTEPRAERPKRDAQRRDEVMARFQALVEQIPAIVYTDPVAPAEPVVSTYVSPQIEELLGITPDEALTDPNWWVGALHPEDLDRAVDASNRADRTGEPYACDYRMVARDGREVWFHDQAVLVRDEDGTPLFWQGAMMDVTERLRAESELQRALELERQAAAELRKADAIRTTFLMSVSHDIRTPLSVILGNALTLENGDRLGITGEERRRLVQTMAAKARRLHEIVTDLLDSERLARGALEPKLQEINVGRLINLLVWDTDVLAGREVHVETSYAPAWVDPQMVARIVENLLLNAARHTPAECQVWVRVFPEDEHVHIVVDDDGPGIPEAHRDSLFRPFDHGPNTSEHDPGIGIGLSLVARFAELHGGRAWVQEREGGGASFHVLIPAGTYDGPPQDAVPPSQPEDQ